MAIYICNSLTMKSYSPRLLLFEIAHYMKWLTVIYENIYHADYTAQYTTCASKVVLFTRHTYS